MKLRLTTAILLALTACDAPSSAGDPGFETGPCIEDECFDGLECLSDLCVGPDGSSGNDAGGPSGPSTVSASNSGPDTSASGDGDGTATTSASASASASDSETSNSGSDSDSASASDSDSDPTLTGDGGTTTGGVDDSGDTSTSTTTGASASASDSDTASASDSDSDTASGGAECGDGSVDPGEQCDSNNLQGFSCADLGLGGGSLACDPITCTFDTSMCGADTGGTTG